MKSGKIYDVHLLHIFVLTDRDHITISRERRTETTLGAACRCGTDVCDVVPDDDNSDSTDELMPAQKLVRQDKERSILLRGGN